MENITWAIMIVWFFLLVIGRAWKEEIFTIAGGIIGLVLMMSVIDESFLFAIALLLINLYVIWIGIISEM